MNDVELFLEAGKKNLQKLPELRAYITILINNGVQAPEQIEPVLEELLEITFSNRMLGQEEFQKLQKYYHSINVERGSFYQNLYRLEIKRINTSLE